ncbi:hypothetical protein GUITHDRAFT_109194 [Guillardia theta CCMP2712]|uniref:Uncharacterized protein n=1 Tax=Guillardia theta (strain CCMP2712) TaxID=905079 RepID=L1J9L6_GUITC|nr:hypothetical protein GUITHDRAFT_109194 [Guillardia theta CCMP2712]EKX44769.1 hypothetical protein GUITHDRAFT_109194 [Guillardia theta CCMP2712]|eukprot:XP_005831749.1 hypothetical protein GUITHDRAFT_109194 [Guillardia theta CCMP2712]
MELLRSTFADLSCAVSMMPRVVRDRKEAELIMHVQQGIQTLAMIEEKLEAIFAQRNVMSRTLEILVLERQCLLLLEKHSAVRKGIKLSSQEMEKYAFLNERLALELNFFVRSAAEDKMCMSIIEKRISQTVQQFVQSVDNSYESEEATGGSKRENVANEDGGETGKNADAKRTFLFSMFHQQGWQEVKRLRRQQA